jgi:type II secretory pathway pseudopilin PulG
MMKTMKHRTATAFTLIEVTIALTIGAVLMASVLYVFNLTRYTAVEAGVRAEMSRDAQLVMDTLRRDLRHAGAGMPALTCQDAGCSFGSSLLPSFRRASNSQVVLIGDLPYPNAEFPGVVTLSRLAGDVDSADVAVTSELSGACTPYAGGVSLAYKCSTATSSPLLWTNASTADDCFEGQTNSRTCPWALNKLQPTGSATPGSGNVSFIAVQVDGNFVTRRWSGTAFADVDNKYGITLTAGSAGGGSTLTRNSFFSSIGSGYLTNLDRVWWAVEQSDGTACSATTNASKCTIKRRQCWGEITNPAAATFPATGTAVLPSTTTPAGCATATFDGTPWETLATNIEQFSLIFHQGNAALSTTTTAVAVADLPNIRAVDVSFTIKRDPPGGGQPLSHVVNERVFLDNRDRVAP